MTDFIELAEDGESASQRIADALKDAREGTTFDAKIKALACAMHILVDPSRPNHLLDNFLDEMLEFSDLGEARIICLIVDFLQKACAKDPSLCSKAVERLSFFLAPNEAIANYVRVMKRVIVSCTNIYPIILEYVIKHNDSEAERCWDAFNVLKGRITMLVDSDNDGIRTVTIKFLESLILCQSPKPREEPQLGGNQQQQSHFNEQNTRFSKISLNDVPRGHRFISYRKAQMEAEQNFSALIKQTTIAHISAQNLLTVVDGMCLIARCRPTWESALSRVFDAIEILHINVPPTLSTAQVKSVRKELKKNLLRFLKLPASVPLQAKIRSQLNYLGATQNEINRSIPAHLVQKPQRQDSRNVSEPAAKKSKPSEAPSVSLFQDDEDEDETPSTSNASGSAQSQRAKDASASAVDVTAQFIFERLSPQVVTNLVLISLMTLPDEMPSSFISSYTPIADAGTEEQRHDVSRMMATQATHAEVGPGFEQMRRLKEKQLIEKQEARHEGIAVAPTPQHAPNTSSVATRGKKPAAVPTGGLAPPTAAPVLKSKKALNLIEETKKLDKREIEELFEIAFESVMRAERRVVQGGATVVYQQLVVRLVSRYKDDCSAIEQKLLDFIVDDHKKRTDLALLWICELYAQYQGYSYCAAWMREQITGDEGATKEVRYERYNNIVCRLLSALVEKNLQDEPLFYKILLEAPLITPDTYTYLRIVCLGKNNSLGMSVLRELILTRNRQRTELMQFFFALCFHERSELRASCIDTAKELCNLPHIRTALSERAVQQLQDCLEQTPPAYFQNPEVPSDAWTEDMYKRALVIYTAIMPFDSSLLMPLASVYASGTTLFKRVVLRSVEPVMRVIGMRDEQLLLLIEQCPPGGETLVARIVHLLTERAPATPDLVMRTKKLHDERHMDIRALIPIIGGLTRDEVIKLMPQFVLREGYQKSVPLVFRRLYNARDLYTGELCFDPIDLITEYHKIDPANEQEAAVHVENLKELFDTRFVKKEAASQAVEAIFEMRPLPYLFMHTLYVLYNKFSLFENFVSTLMMKIADRKLWQHSEQTKKAFFASVAQLKAISYAAVLTCFSYEEFCELKEALGEDIVPGLKDVFPTLSTSQQKHVDPKIKDAVGEKVREERERKTRRDERRDRDRSDRDDKERTTKEDRDRHRSSRR